MLGLRFPNQLAIESSLFSCIGSMISTFPVKLGFSYYRLAKVHKKIRGNQSMH